MIRKRASTPLWVRILCTCVIIIPCAYGFFSKFKELVMVYRGEVDGAFAVTPLTNYLLATTGFLFLFGWATLNGMFRDIEEPKNTMLENEARLDGGQIR